jgi:hypothetical protein
MTEVRFVSGIYDLTDCCSGTSASMIQILLACVFVGENVV